VEYVLHFTGEAAAAMGIELGIPPRAVGMQAQTSPHHETEHFGVLRRGFLHHSQALTTNYFLAYPVKAVDPRAKFSRGSQSFLS
jgi:hypothetical protein